MPLYELKQVNVDCAFRHVGYENYTTRQSVTEEQASVADDITGMADGGGILYPVGDYDGDNVYFLNLLGDEVRPLVGNKCPPFKGKTLLSFHNDLSSGTAKRFSDYANQCLKGIKISALSNKSVYTKAFNAILPRIEDLIENFLKKSAKCATISLEMTITNRGEVSLQAKSPDSMVKVEAHANIKLNDDDKTFFTTRDRKGNISYIKNVNFVIEYKL